VNFAPQNPYAREDYIAAEPDLQRPAPLGGTPSPASAPAIPASDAPAVAATSVADSSQVSGFSPPPSSSSALTYVIFETGSAPYRDQTRIDLPLFVFTDNISYVGMALPELTTSFGHASSLQISTNEGRSYPAALVASMDSVVALDFKNEWPSILTKTILATATKASIDAVLQKQMEDQAGPTGALLFRLATAVTQMAINIADTRTWRSLPKEFHYARLPTPADRQLTLSVGAAAQTLTLEPVAVQVVYVKSTGAYSPLLISQFILKK
jgi:hypothetical protein